MHNQNKKLNYIFKVFNFLFPNSLNFELILIINKYKIIKFIFILILIIIMADKHPSFNIFSEEVFQ